MAVPCMCSIYRLTLELQTVDANIAEGLQGPSITNISTPHVPGDRTVTLLHRCGNDGTESSHGYLRSHRDQYRPRVQIQALGGQSLHAAPATQCPSGVGAVLMGLM